MAISLKPAIDALNIISGQRLLFRDLNAKKEAKDAEIEQSNLSNAVKKQQKDLALLAYANALPRLSFLYFDLESLDKDLADYSRKYPDSNTELESYAQAINDFFTQATTLNDIVDKYEGFKKQLNSILEKEKINKITNHTKLDALKISFGVAAFGALIVGLLTIGGAFGVVPLGLAIFALLSFIIPGVAAVVINAMKPEDNFKNKTPKHIEESVKDIKAFLEAVKLNPAPAPASASVPATNSAQRALDAAPSPAVPVQSSSQPTPADATAEEREVVARGFAKRIVTEIMDAARKEALRIEEIEADAARPTASPAMR